MIHNNISVLHFLSKLVTFKDRLENITRSFSGLRIGGGIPTDLFERCLFGGNIFFYLSGGPLTAPPTLILGVLGLKIKSFLF
ncbi:hypothetical protein R80B4_00268 [Fibrobacteres bacterium R8-0-B4]